ncbi:MAG: hypothetical protein ABUL71_02345, partial [Gemmatimonadota bacterium]
RAVPADNPLWPRAAWTLTIDAIDRNDDAARDSLMALLHARSSMQWIADLDTIAIAFTLGQRGQFDSAMALTRRIHRIPREAEAGLRGPFVRAMVYLSRGEWRRRAGDAARADSEWVWHENNDMAGKPEGEPDQGEIDAALSAVARLLRAENLPALDRYPEACAMLKRVNELWRDAESSMQPLQARVANGRRVACRGR